MAVFAVSALFIHQEYYSYLANKILKQEDQDSQEEDLRLRTEVMNRLSAEGIIKLHDKIENIDSLVQSQDSNHEQLKVEFLRQRNLI